MSWAKPAAELDSVAHPALLMRKDPIGPLSSLPTEVGHSQDTTAAVVSYSGMLAVARPLRTLTVAESQARRS